jgi:hypothetical protein
MGSAPVNGLIADPVAIRDDRVAQDPSYPPISRMDRPTFDNVESP